MKRRAALRQFMKGPDRTDREPGDMVKVKIVDAEEYDLIGERI